MLTVVMALLMIWSCSGNDPDTPLPSGFGDETEDSDTLVQNPPDTAKNDTPNDPPSENHPLLYLALGDSYTIGQGVSEEERWPVQLVSQLASHDLKISSPKIIAVTGWTTGDLKNGIKAQAPDSSYDLVSLLIGVNNQYRGYDIDIFEMEFTQLLTQAIYLAKGNKDRVVVLSIPDYGVTPFASSADREKIASEINAYNALKKSICDSKGVSFYNITDISRQAASDRSLLASDNLHPSGKMYKLWVDLIQADIAQKLKD